MAEQRTAAQIAAEVVRAARTGASVAVATLVSAPEGAAVSPGAKLLVRAGATRLGSLGAGFLDEAVAADALEAMATLPRTPTQYAYYAASGERLRRLDVRAEDTAFEVMIEVIESPATLLIVGGGHIGLSLATIGAHAGFSVAVIDDRKPYANPERFPMADTVLAGDVGKLLDEFPVAVNTYAVLVSRGHKVDEVALKHVIGRGAAYVGMIGSKRRVSTVLRHLAEEGHALTDLERVHTPIGLDIGAETPEEIAISIMAEVIMVRRSASGRQMREGRPRIRAGVRD